MKRILAAELIFVLLCALDLSQAKAQMALDPSTASLLRGSSSPDSGDLDSSGRFIKAPEKPVEKLKRKPKSDDPALIVKKATPTKAEAAPKQDTPNAAKPAPVQQTQAPAPTAPAQAPSVPASLGEQVKLLILGGNSEEIEGYKKQIDPRDRRNNRVEISVAPSYFYDNSSSNYSIRSLSSQGPGFDASAKVWLTPFFGIHAGYFNSLDSSVTSQGPKQNVPYNVQNIDIGVDFRKHFGIRRKAPSLTWQLRYVVDESSVPSDTPDRVSTVSSGLSLGLQAEIPQTYSYVHVIGAEIQPKLVQSENSNDAIHSGGSCDTNAVGAWIGGEWVLDRQDQLFWRLHERVEQDSFDGAASFADPKSGITPNGVNVTNSLTIFSIGYRWGS